MRAEIIGLSASITPLCPAGHLPHRWGDRQVAGFLQNVEIGSSEQAQPISLLVGEMPGRAEGGITPAIAHRVAPASTRHSLLSSLTPSSEASQ
jgi:hypothetical protein